MNYIVKRNGRVVDGKIIYTKKGLFFESGKELYESGGVKVEANFTNRPTDLFCIIMYFIFTFCLMFTFLYK